MVDLSERHDGGAAEDVGGLGEILAGHGALPALPHHHQPEHEAAQGPGQAQVHLQHLHLPRPQPLEAGLLDLELKNIIKSPSLSISIQFSGENLTFHLNILPDKIQVCSILKMSPLLMLIKFLLFCFSAHKSL